MEKAKTPHTTMAAGGRAASTVEMKSKSRLAALAPGENLKEKQVCCVEK